MKNIVIISTSLRRNSNSDLLARAFAEGAESAGHAVEIISLAGKRIDFCIGCIACQKTQRCVLHDDAQSIADKIGAADAVVFATPIYYNEMCGQMKTLLDRCNPLYRADYRFRDVYLLMTSADTDAECMEAAIHGMQGWIDCFSKSRLVGVVRGLGIRNPGDASDHPDVLTAAREYGKNV